MDACIVSLESRCAIRHRAGGGGQFSPAMLRSDRPTLGLLPRFRRRNQYGSATLLGSAPARPARLNRLGNALASLDTIVVGQLFARPDITDGADENALVFLVGIAVRIAGVVDPARDVAPCSTIDVVVVGDAEDEGVVQAVHVFGIAARVLGLADDLAFVLAYRFVLA